MEVLKITLKQHTPLIHFQHDQYGATLRASEVKPKLDKYIQSLINENLYSRYCIKDTNALKYKLEIIANESDKIPISIPVSSKIKEGKRVFEATFPFILSNMDAKEKESDLINFSYYKKITLIFITSHKKIKELINEYIDEFFAVNNFGNRQDKGFGSFFRDKADLESFETALSNVYTKLYSKRINAFSLPVNFTNLKNAFFSLEKDYKKLKSGINRCESLLKRYGEEEYNYQWEKIAIKKAKKNDDIPNNTYYLRALLGATTAMPYINDRQIVEIESELDENGNEIVQRFSSPIVFKIFNNMVFALPNDENLNAIIGKRFKFSIKREKDKRLVHEPFYLEVPSINLYDFIDFGLSELQWNENIFD